MKLKTITIITLLLLLVTTPSLAATPATPSAEATSSSTPTSIEEKIKKLVTENLSATESSLKEKINQQTLLGFVGLIQTINSGNLTLDSSDNGTLQISISDKTIISKGGNTIKLSALAISDKVIVIGTLLKEDITMAKRIIVVPNEPPVMVSGTVVAKISSIDLKKKTVYLVINNKETPFLLTKKSTIKLEELNPNSTIFAITKKYDGKDYLSRAKVI